MAPNQQYGRKRMLSKLLGASVVAACYTCTTWWSATFIAPQVPQQQRRFSNVARSFFADGQIAKEDEDDVQERLSTARASRSYWVGPKFLKMVVSREWARPFSKNKYEKAADVQDRHDVAFRVSTTGDHYPFQKDGDNKVVLITGEEDNVLAAFEEMLPRDIEANFKMGFLTPKSAAGQLIGTGGDRITQARESIGVDIQLRKNSGEEAYLEGFGTKNQLIGTAKWLLDQQTEFANEARQFLNVDYVGSRERGLHKASEIFMRLTEDQKGSVIGKQGKNIGHIMKKFAVMLNVDNDTSILKIEGRLGDTHACHAFLVNRFDELDRRRGANPRQLDSLAKEKYAGGSGSAQPQAVQADA